MAKFIIFCLCIFINAIITSSTSIDVQFMCPQLTRFTQGAILWVCGDRKWTFSTTTVTHILKTEHVSDILLPNKWCDIVAICHVDCPIKWAMINILMCYDKYSDPVMTKSWTYLNETNIMANIRYLPSRGTTREVGGMISTTSRKNT